MTKGWEFNYLLAGPFPQKPEKGSAKEPAKNWVGKLDQRIQKDVGGK